MRILDLDLDFFLNDIAHWTDFDKRLSDDEYSPWSSKIVINFLENQCGLRRDTPIPGRIVEHHDGAFLSWRELIDQNRLTSPFEVVHVDAHADLGLGDAGYEYLMTDVLHREVEKRQFPLMGIHQCGLGNYLAFAVACRWLSQLTYVTHDKWSHDLLRYHFKDCDPNSGILQLKKANREMIDKLIYEYNKGEFVPLALEPEVPFFLLPGKNYKDNGDFDFIVLAKSPGFTPPSADHLIPIIADYMKCE